MVVQARRHIPAPDASQLADEMSGKGSFLKYRDDGDIDAGNDFARLQIPRLERIATIRSTTFRSNGITPEDVVQHTFLKLLRNPSNFDPTQGMNNYLNAILNSASIDLHRRQNAQCRGGERGVGGEHGGDKLSDLFPSKSGVSPSAQLESMEMAQKVREALSSLSEPVRDAVELVYFQGLKYKDAAAQLGIPTGTLKSRLGLARKQLAKDHPELAIYYESNRF